MKCKNEIMSTLMFSQLECEDHKPIEADINQNNEMNLLRFLTTLAACMTFNTVCLPSRFPLSLFNQVEFSESKHWKSLFYREANAIYYHNLVLVLKMIDLPFKESSMNRSLFSTFNAVADITGYMIHGVFSNWKDMTFSNVGKSDGKKSGKSTGMHCIEFFFLFPLVSGTFANC